VTPRSLVLVGALLALACGATVDPLGHDPAPQAEPVPNSDTLRPLAGPASYPSPFHELLGKTQQEVDAKLAAAFERLRSARKVARIPLVDVLSTYRRETLIAIGLKVTEVAWVNILSVFAVAYLTKQLGMSQSFILDAVTLATLFELFIMPSAGSSARRGSRCSWTRGADRARRVLRRGQPLRYWRGHREQRRSETG